MKLQKTGENHRLKTQGKNDTELFWQFLIQVNLNSGKTHKSPNNNQQILPQIWCKCEPLVAQTFSTIQHKIPTLEIKN